MTSGKDMPIFSGLKIASILLMILIFACNEKEGHRRNQEELPNQDNSKGNEEKLKEHSGTFNVLDYGRLPQKVDNLKG